MHIQKQIRHHLKRAIRISLTLAARGVLTAISGADELRARRGRKSTAAPEGQTGPDGTIPSKAGVTGPVSATDTRAPAIDLAQFDDEEFDALLTGEWGVGWRMNERAINRRQVLARSLSEFLGSVEPEKTH